MKLRLHSERLVIIVARKKVVFVIVEGPSDDGALGVLLYRIYDKNLVFLKIMRGDITTEKGVNENVIVSKIGNVVRQYAKENHFTKDDFQEIIHIVDTDGAFVTNDAVIEDSSAVKPSYSLTEIRTANKVGIERRNEQKSNNLNRLIGQKDIWNIPYRILYMSCNLDHVLFDKQNSTKEEKEQDSLRFAICYRDRVPEFIKFIKESNFSVNLDYQNSWNYIKSERHSLERHSNFGLCLPTILMD